MTRRISLAGLAAIADVDIEEALVTLWDLGVEGVEGPEDLLPTQDTKRAKAALGISSPREQGSVDYWTRRTGMSRSELTELLGGLGVTLRPSVRRLPKGAAAKLRRQFRALAEPEPEMPRALEPCPPLEWAPIGSPRHDIHFLNEEDLRRIHEALVDDFAADDDPIQPPGIRSEHLLSSALSRSQTALGNDWKYPTVEMAGAALLHSLVLNHPFHNGNKRTGLVALLVYLDANGFMATCDERSLFRFVLRVAQHGLVPAHCDELADREVVEMAGWIRSNSRRIEKGERPLPWHRLRRILRNFGCESQVSSNVGNRINLSRDVERPPRFGRRSRSEHLSIQVAYGDEGRTVERNTLNTIRHVLELDEEHGVDSRSFYEADAVPDDFIQQYRTLLRRLAKL